MDNTHDDDEWAAQAVRDMLKRALLALSAQFAALALAQR